MKWFALSAAGCRSAAIAVGAAALLLTPVASAQAAAPSAPTTADASAPTNFVFTENVSTISAKTAAGAGVKAPAAAAAAAASGCKEITATVTAQNALGSTLYTFQQVADWCYNGSTTSSRTSEFHTTSPYIGWGYRDMRDQYSTGTNPWIRYRQAHFNQCLWDPVSFSNTCSNDSYPWIKMSMYANGTYSIGHGIDS